MEIWCVELKVSLVGRESMHNIDFFLTLNFFLGVEVIMGPRPLVHNIETVDCSGCSVSVVRVSELNPSP